MILRFIGTDTVLNGKTIKHGNIYVVNQINSRLNKWLWFDIIVDETRIRCPYSTVGTFMENWELV